MKCFFVCVSVSVWIVCVDGRCNKLVRVSWYSRARGHFWDLCAALAQRCDGWLGGRFALCTEPHKFLQASQIVSRIARSIHYSGTRNGVTNMCASVDVDAIWIYGPVGSFGGIIRNCTISMRLEYRVRWVYVSVEGEMGWLCDCFRYVEKWILCVDNRI